MNKIQNTEIKTTAWRNNKDKTREKYDNIIYENAKLLNKREGG